MGATPEEYMRQAIALAIDGVERGFGGPFGALIVRAGHVIGRGQNRVLVDNDPTAHAEVVAIREASAALGDFRLVDCTLYTSCEPCPMCLASAMWARLDRIVYAGSSEDAAAVGFDDAFFYDELEKPLGARALPMEQLLRQEAGPAFQAWSSLEARKDY
jgi:tRNA(Arg) A34 adenosine deaminase TadA